MEEEDAPDEADGAVRVGEKDVADADGGGCSETEDAVAEYSPVLARLTWSLCKLISAARLRSMAACRFASMRRAISGSI